MKFVRCWSLVDSGPSSRDKYQVPVALKDTLQWASYHSRVSQSSLQWGLFILVTFFLGRGMAERSMRALCSWRTQASSELVLRSQPRAQVRTGTQLRLLTSWSGPTGVGLKLRIPNGHINQARSPNHLASILTAGLVGMQMTPTFVSPAQVSPWVSFSHVRPHPLHPHSDDHKGSLSKTELLLWLSLDLLPWSPLALSKWLIFPVAHVETLEYPWLLSLTSHI